MVETNPNVPIIILTTCELNIVVFLKNEETELKTTPRCCLKKDSLNLKSQNLKIY